MGEQDGWQLHAAFMDVLAAEGFIVLGGPIGQDDRRILLVVEAAHVLDVHSRLLQDPWSQAGLLLLMSVTPWQVLLTGKRVSG